MKLLRFFLFPKPIGLFLLSLIFSILCTVSLPVNSFAEGNQSVSSQTVPANSALKLTTSLACSKQNLGAKAYRTFNGGKILYLCKLYQKNFIWYPVNNTALGFLCSFVAPGSKVIVSAPTSKQVLPLVCSKNADGDFVWQLFSPGQSKGGNKVALQPNWSGYQAPVAHFNKIAACLWAPQAQSYIYIYQYTLSKGNFYFKERSLNDAKATLNLKFSKLPKTASESVKHYGVKDSVIFYDNRPGPTNLSSYRPGVGFVNDYQRGDLYADFYPNNWPQLAKLGQQDIYGYENKVVKVINMGKVATTYPPCVGK